MQNTQFISNRLRACRKETNLLQVDVAKSLGLDCADRISRWENGTAMPNVINLFKLAAIYNVMPHDLYPELLQVTKEQSKSTENN